MFFLFFLRLDGIFSRRREIGLDGDIVLGVRGEEDFRWVEGKRSEV